MSSFLFIADMTLIDAAVVARTLLGCCFTVTIFSLPLLTAALLASAFLRKQNRTNFASLLLRVTIVFQALLCLGCALVPIYQVSRVSRVSQVSADRENLSVTAPRYLPYTTPGLPPFDAFSPEIPSGDETRTLAPIAFVLVAGIWVSGSFVLLLGLIFSAVYLHRLHLGSDFLAQDHPAYHLLQTIDPFLAQRRLLKACSETSIPFATGPPFAFYGIFLPTNFDTISSPMGQEEVARAVLAHEAEHLRRRDPTWSAANRLLAVLLWPSPLQWLLLREMDRVQELACDEKAVQGSPQPAHSALYANCLLEFAAASSRAPYRLRHGSAAIATARPSLLEERVQNIMAGTASRPTPLVGSRVRIALLSGAALFVGGSLFFAAQTAPASQLPQVSTGGASPKSPSGQSTITVSLVDEVVIDVLTKLASLSKLKLDIEPEARQRLQGKVTLAMTDQPLDNAIRLVLRSASDGHGPLRHEVKGDTVHVYVVKVDDKGLPIKTVSLNYPRPTEVKTVLNDLFSNTGFEVGYFTGNGTNQIRVRVTDVPLAQALEKILQQAPVPLKYSVDNGRVQFKLLNPPPPVITKELPTKLVSADFQNTPLRTALGELLNSARCDFSVSNEVSITATITDKFKDIPLSVALPRLLNKSATPLEYIVQNGVVIIRSARQ